MNVVMTKPSSTKRRYGFMCLTVKPGDYEIFTRGGIMCLGNKQTRYNLIPHLNSFSYFYNYQAIVFIACCECKQFS